MKQRCVKNAMLVAATVAAAGPLSWLNGNFEGAYKLADSDLEVHTQDSTLP